MVKGAKDERVRGSGSGGQLVQPYLAIDPIKEGQTGLSLGQGQGLPACSLPASLAALKGLNGEEMGHGVRVKLSTLRSVGPVLPVAIGYCATFGLA